MLQGRITLLYISFSMSGRPVSKHSNAGKRNEKLQLTDETLLANSSVVQVALPAEALLVNGYHISLAEDTYPCLGGHPDIRY